MTETVIERNVNQDVINNLQNLIQSYLESLDKLKRDIKQANEMLNDGLVGNAAYHDANEKVKEVSKKKSQIRLQIMSTPEMAGMSAKLKDLKTDLKEKKASLSDYLLEYERLSGVNVIETVNGEQLSIFKIAKAEKVR